MVVSGVGPGEHGEKTGIWVINVLTATPHQILGDAEAAVPSPDGSLIAFRNTNGQPHIMVVDASGENVRTIAGAESHENYGKIQWSADGKRVAFLVRHVGNETVAIDSVAVTGGPKTRLLEQPNLRSFVWLPDGRFVFAVQSSSNPSGAFLGEMDEHGHQTRLELGAGMSIADMSATADGKQLALVRRNDQTDVYEAEMDKTGALAAPRRITLDDRNDRPNAWVPGARYVLFDSDRNGNFDVFRQRLDSSVAEPIAIGAEQQFGAQVTPEGRSVLYWSLSPGATRMALMRIDVAGGPATSVLEAASDSDLRCPVSPQASCVLAQIQVDKVRFSSIDPASGNLRNLVDVDWKHDANTPLVWALAPDGSQAAALTQNTLRVADLRTGRTQDIPAPTDLGKVTGISFLPGSKDLLVTTNSSKENLLLRIAPSGTRRVWTSPQPISSPIPSPDGKRVLLCISSSNSNVWLIENLGGGAR